MRKWFSVFGWFGKMAYLTAIITMALFLVWSCATAPVIPNSPSDQREREFIGGVQALLPALYNAGLIYQANDPKAAAAWPAVVASFQATNIYLASLEAQGADGNPISLTTALTSLQTDLGPILTAYLAWASTPSVPGASMTQAQEVLLAITVADQALIFTSQLIGYFGGSVPTWQTIIAENTAFGQTLPSNPVPAIKKKL